MKQVNVGVFVLHSPAGDQAALEAFAMAVADGVRSRLEEATGLKWAFHLEHAHRLADDEPRRPSDFVDEAARRMSSTSRSSPACFSPRWGSS